MEIRGFDVPTMVVLSAVLARGSYERSKGTGDFISKRVKRLVIPTWIFLVGFYVCMLIVGKLPSYSDVIKSFFFQRDSGIAGYVWIIWIYILWIFLVGFYVCMLIVGKLPSYSDVIKSFFFQRDSGIAGYVWIIWIYILCACVVPVYEKIERNMSTKKALIIIFFTTIGYELICKYTMLYEYRILYYTIFSIIPYGIITCIAMLYSNLKKSEKSRIIVSLLGMHLIYVFILAKEGYVSVNLFKYPARFYYWSYGVPIGFLLIELFKKLDLKLRNSGMIVFVSKHSLWIYLWHIFALAIVKYVIGIENWIIQFIFVFGFSIIATLVQVKIIKSIQKIYDKQILKYFLC